MSDTLQTEFEFHLPLGYIDENGARHHKGTMRLATAADEILPMEDPRVQSNPAYLTIILLARVIERLGTLEMIDQNVIQNLFARDFEYLQDLFDRINFGESSIEITCPKCHYEFPLDLEDEE